jgi:hypothetical protein
VILSPFWRKVALIAHVVVSVGWAGAVVVFLAVTAIGLTSPDESTVRAVYLLMEPAAWLSLIPLSVASLVTGVVSSVGTTWGLLRHYWVVFKLLINVVATVVLVLYMQTFAAMARLAADPAVQVEVVRNPSPALHGGIALAALLVATVLAIAKPRGVTPLG